MAVHHSYLPYCRRFLLFYLLVMAIVSFAKKVTLLVESLRKKDTGTDLAGKLLIVGGGAHRGMFSLLLHPNYVIFLSCEWGS